MNLIKHSKIKNTGILFELLVRQITADTLDGKDSPVKDLLKKYFVKTELGREYKLYETLLKKTTLTETKANIIVNTLIESSKILNRGTIKRQKYNLIKEIKDHYNIEQFFNHKLPNYKVYAAFYTLLETYNYPQITINPEQIINNKITILEHLTAAPITEKKVADDVMDAFINEDKDVRLLSYKISMEKFNTKYNNFTPEQKAILKEYMNSVDNTTRLKEFYTNKTTEIKNQLQLLNTNTHNPVTQIKINEIISLIGTPGKNQRIKDHNVIDLLQYYDLIKELEHANG
jgi:hypothetical protein